MLTAEHEHAQLIPQNPLIQVNNQSKYQQGPTQNFHPKYEEPVAVRSIQPQIIASPEQLTLGHIQGFGIKDKVSFHHMFKKQDPFMCGIMAERSTFQIEKLGILECGYETEVCCSCLAMCSCCTYCCRNCTKCFKCDLHFYPHPDYVLDNKTGLKMEFWQNGIGRIKILDMPVIDFIQTFPNVCDILYGHCQSSYPKLLLTYALGYSNTKLELKPDVSTCPETIGSLLPEFAIFGMGQKIRNFTVTGLTQGTCLITNTRTCGEACAKICRMQGCFCLPHIDYPHFDVEFIHEVSQLDKLAIIMGLVHYSMFKKWYVMTRITRSVVGVA